MEVIPTIRITAEVVSSVNGCRYYLRQTEKPKYGFVDRYHYKRGGCGPRPTCKPIKLLIALKDRASDPTRNSSLSFFIYLYFLKMSSEFSSAHWATCQIKVSVFYPMIYSHVYAHVCSTEFSCSLMELRYPILSYPWTKSVVLRLKPA